MKNTLKKPPVKEVVFEVQFEPKMEYTEFLLEIRDLIKKDYPIIRSTPQGETVPLNVLGNIKVVRNLLFSADEKNIIGIGKGVISIHSLKHTNFSQFLPQIKKVLLILNNLENNLKVSRIGLRYINSINRPKNELLNNIFTSDLLSKLESKKGQLNSFNNLSSFKIDDSFLNLRFIKNPNSPTIFLDLDIYHSGIIDKLEIENWTNTAHKKLYSFFESSFTKSYFQKIK